MTNELYHHGILGQKWGVRRYQNPDGSLTELGRRRYLKGLGGDKQKETTVELANIGLHKQAILNQTYTTQKVNGRTVTRDSKGKIVSPGYELLKSSSRVADVLKGRDDTVKELKDIVYAEKEHAKALKKHNAQCREALSQLYGDGKELKKRQEQYAKLYPSSSAIPAKDQKDAFDGWYLNDVAKIDERELRTAADRIVNATSAYVDKVVASTGDTSMNEALRQIAGSSFSGENGDIIQLARSAVKEALRVVDTKHMLYEMDEEYAAGNTPRR